MFPPLRLLLGLSGDEETPARTPWWLLLLRLIAAACLIVALADPLIGKAPQIAGTGPMVLFIDNGWTAAANWDARQAVIADVLRTASNQGRAVAIVPTADVPDVSLMDAGKAARIAQALTPEPWLPDRARAAAAITKAKFAAKPEITLAKRRDRGWNSRRNRQRAGRRRFTEDLCRRRRQGTAGSVAAVKRSARFRRRHPARQCRRRTQWRGQRRWAAMTKCSPVRAFTSMAA